MSWAAHRAAKPHVRAARSSGLAQLRRGEPLRGSPPLLRRPCVTPERAPRDTLEPCVGIARAVPHHCGDLIRQARALMADGVRHGWASRDLVDEDPQLLALEQPGNSFVDDRAF